MNLGFWIAVLGLAAPDRRARKHAVSRASNPQPAVRSRRGFTLVEVILAILVVGVGLTASMRALTAVMNTSRVSRESRLARELALNLLAEISLLPFEDPDGSPVFGPEPGEGTSTRAAFDDIDDYRARSESPPQKKDGTVEAGTTGYTRSVAVVSVSPTNFETVLPDGSSDAKRITVAVSRAGMRPVSLTTVRLKGANREDLP